LLISEKIMRLINWLERAFSLYQNASRSKATATAG